MARLLLPIAALAVLSCTLSGNHLQAAPLAGSQAHDAAAKATFVERAAVVCSGGGCGRVQTGRVHHKGKPPPPGTPGAPIR